MKFSTGLFFFSVLSSIAYGIANPENFGVENNPIIGYFFWFSIGLFLLGLSYTVRIIWFIVDPSSRANILVGKALKVISVVGFKIAIIGSIVSFQVFNGIELYLITQAAFVFHIMLKPIAIPYTFALILSFIGMIPLIKSLIFRFKEQMRHRDWVALIFFVTPWIILFVYTTLMKFGIAT